LEIANFQHIAVLHFSWRTKRGRAT